LKGKRRKGKRRTHIPSANKDFQIQKRLFGFARETVNGVESGVRVVEELRELLADGGGGELEAHGVRRGVVMNAKQSAEKRKGEEKRGREKKKREKKKGKKEERGGKRKEKEREKGGVR
jgi:hypothetical protein